MRQAAAREQGRRRARRAPVREAGAGPHQFPLDQIAPRLSLNGRRRK